MYSELNKTDEEYICVIGDSFAGNRRGTKTNISSYDWSWVNLLEANNSGKVVGKSFPGQSFWHQRRWFMDNLMDWPRVKNTVLIFVHTQYARLPHINDLPITGHIFKADRNNPEQNELYFKDPTGSLFDLAKTFYSSSMYDEEFYKFAFIAWLKEINEVTVNYKKVIHLFGFENSLANLPSTQHRFYLEKLAQGNSIPVTNTLVSLTAAERGSISAFGGPDIGPNVQNHLNKHNNIELAKFIQWTINEARPGVARHIPLETFDLKDPSLIHHIALHRPDFDKRFEIPGSSPE
jgi:hypothetical protein